MKDERPRVGVAVLIIKEDKVLIGLRQQASTHEAATWGLPGGKLHFGESFVECVRRETAEECGVNISEPVFADITNDVFEKDGLHYITIFMRADWVSGEPKVLEPDKMAKWQWVKWEDLPSPLFLPMQNLVRSGFKP